MYMLVQAAFSCVLTFPLLFDGVVGAVDSSTARIQEGEKSQETPYARS